MLSPAKTDKRIQRMLSEFYGDCYDHGRDHIERVITICRVIIPEGADVDMLVLDTAAVMHDVRRKHEINCHANEGAEFAEEYLRKEGLLNNMQINNVCHSIRAHRYSKGKRPETLEALILKEADRLDAIGAIAIVRALSYGIRHQMTLHDIEIPPKDIYDGKSETIINHFHEKLLKIDPDSFSLPKAKKLAEQRHWIMKTFVDKFSYESDSMLDPDANNSPHGNDVFAVTYYKDSDEGPSETFIGIASSFENGKRMVSEFIEKAGLEGCENITDDMWQLHESTIFCEIGVYEFYIGKESINYVGGEF